jgi:pyruvate/2-oxoglutarate/acetoin dehydrogenase E1 component
LNSKYFDEMKRAMKFLSNQPDTLFIGQAVSYPGTAMYNTLEDVDKEKCLEMPVDEDFQMGISIGFALRGRIPVSIFPRWNFLLLATNQIVNHLNHLKEITQSINPGKVIIRTGIGSINPLNPGPQHSGDYTDAFRIMCDHMEVIRLDNSQDIFPAYQHAYSRTDGTSTLLVEWSDKHND